MPRERDLLWEGGQTEAPAERYQPAEKIDPDRTYRIVCPAGWTMGKLSKTLRETPSRAKLADTTVRQALADYLARHPELIE